MDIENILKEETKNAANKIYGLNLELKDIEINRTPSPEFGDYSTNIAMQLAKTLHKNPFEIATGVTSYFQQNKIGFIKDSKAVKPGFTNYYIEDEYYKGVLPQILKEKDNYGKSNLGKGKNIIIEYSSPNIAKPFTIGHLRSTIIGDSLARILDFNGFNVYRDNHLGDWGAAFGKQLAAFEMYPEELETLDQAADPIKKLVALYVKFNADCEKDPTLIEKSRNWFKKLEEGDPLARQLWQKCVDLTFKELTRIYKELGVLPFTENKGKGYGEAFFENKMGVVIEELKEKDKQGIIDYHQSEGAWLVFFPDNILPPLMILKSNGTTLYSTRDLATDKFRTNPKLYGEPTDYGYPNLIVINETGVEQKLYWQQIFKTEEMLGWYQPGQRKAIMHGLYRFKDGKMSTRKGNVIWLDDVLNEAKKRALDLSADKRQDEKGEYSEQAFNSMQANHEKIGIGALKWNDLKRNTEQDIIFDWDEVINLKGNSSPYIQYSHVRTVKVLEKAEKLDYVNVDVQKNIELNPEELSLLKILVKFQSIVIEAANAYSPSVICQYLYTLAQVFNAFYDKHNILKASDENTKIYRLQLTAATEQIIRTGLNLLGIETVDKM